jgi:hypothetical protein
VLALPSDCFPEIDPKLCVDSTEREYFCPIGPLSLSEPSGTVSAAKESDAELLRGLCGAPVVADNGDRANELYERDAFLI